MSIKIWIAALLFGAFVWFVGESGGPVIAAAFVGAVGVANSFYHERKTAELDKRLEDLSWRLRHVMKEE
ncbi:hypothetical protein I7F13_04920 [Sinorhizobium meliloti]|uniref:hypothetical protein n=1 Tax=Rhizobium meliloti TaxID=382 RepID=UPI000FD87DE2|nr:hypothetical protein [Sinorhizobium meliloti]MDE3821773.1 hypothetical protein [Sinorhizobium meliloti]MDX1114768.1 hypothetical protein [Sinorhizobium medicae]RVM40399.1 hypothetical protein CN127_31830 [Sinorhizobium meliloti]RVN55163.1 hypothetical protein CN106_35205 [Sinorhizobium meliloti]